MNFAELMFTPAVQAQQTARGSRTAYARAAARAAAAPTELSEHEADFLRAADTLFLATVNEHGWPYVQHRGGPPGFVHVLSPRQIAFADFGGNRQYVSVGNVATNDRCSVLVLDFARQRRLKLLGHLRFVPLDDIDDALFDVADVGSYEARVERVATIEVIAYDWNCPQHITPRYTQEEVAAAGLAVPHR